MSVAVHHHADSTRDRIVMIAADLFAEHGYHNTGMAQLEAAVGLRRGALYHHIGSKEALLFDISTGRLEAVTGELEAIAASGAPVETRLRQMAATALGSFAAHRSEWCVHSRDFTALTGAHLDAVLSLRRRYELVWTGVVCSALPPLSTDALTLSVAVKGILGMLNYTHVWMHADGPMDPGDIADLLCNLVLRGLASVAG